jgi:hypothetical protein
MKAKAGYNGELPATHSLSHSGKSIKPVSEKYFGMKFGDSQSADEPYDPNSKVQANEGVFTTGRGTQGGGSKSTPQAIRMTTGSGSRNSKTMTPTSYPKQSQKIRG